MIPLQKAVSIEEEEKKKKTQGLFSPVILAIIIETV
jgi:hypothetical protein